MDARTIAAALETIHTPSPLARRGLSRMKAIPPRHDKHPVLMEYHACIENFILMGVWKMEESHEPLL
jgi:hypothetical protein